MRKFWIWFELAVFFTGVTLFAGGIVMATVGG
jgi:hypothetical protein